jgi:hypothetical protein
VGTLVVGKIDLPLRAGLTERVLGGDEITVVETVAAELHGEGDQQEGEAVSIRADCGTGAETGD